MSNEADSDHQVEDCVWPWLSLGAFPCPTLQKLEVASGQEFLWLGYLAADDSSVIYFDIYSVCYFEQNEDHCVLGLRLDIPIPQLAILCCPYLCFL